MNISEFFDFLNFWVNKYTGSFYTIPELELITDRGQMSLYSDMQPEYARSQTVKDALSPFKDTYEFGYSDSLNGLIIIPSDRNYLNLLDFSISYDISARSIEKHLSIEMTNEDETSYKLESQIDPITNTSPMGEMVGVGKIQLNPKVQYRGKVSFLRRPVKPVFGYSVISGRVIVYNPNTSVQLEWGENFQNSVAIKALASIGINIGEADIQQYAQLKTSENYQNINKL